MKLLVAALATILASQGVDQPDAPGRGYSASISADGRLVAFSNARNVFVRDLQAGTTTLVSRASGPDGAAAEDVGFMPYLATPSISADGRFVAFASAASNLHPGDTDQDSDVFVRNMYTHETALASGAGASYQPSISGDGRLVAFNVEVSRRERQIFVRDMQTGETSLVSRASGPGGVEGNGYSDDPSISSDGRFVAFESTATNLHPRDTSPDSDVFLRNLQTGATLILTPVFRRAEAESPSISANGRYLAYETWPGGTSHVFVHDRRRDRTTLVSRMPGRDETPADGENPSISADGRYVAFVSWESRLDAFVSGSRPDVFLRDLRAGTTTLVSRASGPMGDVGVGGSHDPAVSAGGRYVAFESRSENLHPADRDRSGDVYVRRVVPRRSTPRVSCLGRRAGIVLLPSSEPAAGTKAAEAIAGSKAPDEIEGAGGRDRICGRARNDVILVRDGSVDVVDCGGGRDRVVADRIDRLRRCERS